MDGNNRFSPQERALLLGVKGVGPSVIGRLEQLGYHTLAGLAGLAEADTTHIVQMVASMLGSTCWQNSPQARSAIDGAIALARAHLVADAAKGVNG
ncbi:MULTISPECIES: Pathogenicity locus [Aeromonas]|uniref:Pathogenicity locus n=1 Tax=Aeromonas veronii TaxID=654 RepID=A0A2T4N525_AERVE|nr:Pathogenicity locus [Aeromonas veronii]AXV22009.1 Pathogenicity locus [Aeromonas veronii]MBA2797655.1 helix-hairpin-helix domain-containing protein [Aeromonas veronii]MCX0441968.1 helix-hairpin-helix domain-containing protein [Aeromonas veronii]PTH81903.1 Pathogenicity locus [Aeromonas veronii]RDE63784.1 helix-hairpin-helix domain-containing protein [Aeromonas veronii]